MSYQGFDFYSAEIVSEIKKSAYVGDVFDYAETALSNYPAVIVTSSDLSGQFADTSRNKDTFSFNILVLADRLNRAKDVESTMRVLVDDIVTRLNNNTTINGNSNTFGKPVSIKWGYGSAPEPDMRIAQIDYQIVVGQ